MGIINPANHLENVEIFAIASRNIKKANEFSKKYSIPKVYNNYDDLIMDKDVDIIYNALPNSLHAFWTTKAIRNNKHVNFN